MVTTYQELYTFSTFRSSLHRPLDLFSPWGVTKQCGQEHPGIAAHKYEIEREVDHAHHIKLLYFPFRVSGAYEASGENSR